MAYYSKQIKNEIRKSIKSNKKSKDKIQDNQIDKNKENIEELVIKKKEISKFVFLISRTHPILIKHILICIFGALTALH